MNFLAHLHLSPPHPEGRLGGILGDFVTGDPSDRYQERVCEGIHLHRKIDAYTDRRPAWKRSKLRLSPRRRRFAGAVVDVFYDHFLALDWELYEPSLSLQQSIQMYYGELESLIPIVADEDAAFALRRLVRGDLLGSYSKVEGISVAIDCIALRSQRFEAIIGAGEELNSFVSETLRAVE